MRQVLFCQTKQVAGPINVMGHIQFEWNNRAGSYV
jgi:hypothetical protein